MTPEIDMESITFKASPGLADYIRRGAFTLDKSASEIIRACCILALPQVLALRGLDRVNEEDIRSCGNDNQNKVGRE